MEKNRCEGCVYYRHLNGYEGARCCHYILVEHRMRVRDGEKCYSFKRKKRLDKSKINDYDKRGDI